MRRPEDNAENEQPLQITGLEQILRLQPLLVRWSEACGQPGAADFLRYFLTGPYIGSKIPHLFLYTDGTPLCELTDAGQLRGAVLLHEYVRGGMSFRTWVGRDAGGQRNVIAPVHSRLHIAAALAEHLIQRGAWLVLLPVQGDGTSVIPSAAKSSTELRLATLHRQVRHRLPLGATYDSTLASFGSHTRRNFRSFRRRAEADLHCTFVPAAEVSESDFLQLNRGSSYPAPDFVAKWNFQSAQSEAGCFLCGIRTGNGQWLSLLGGRRVDGVSTSIDWQMNRADLAAASLSTVLRSYLIEHEIGIGARSLYFEGGTPHAMQSAFVLDSITSIVAVPSWLPVRVLRKLILRLPHTNILAETFSDPALQWQPVKPPVQTTKTTPELVARLRDKII